MPDDFLFPLTFYPKSLVIYFNLKITKYLLSKEFILDIFVSSQVPLHTLQTIEITPKMLLLLLRRLRDLAIPTS